MKVVVTVNENYVYPLKVMLYSLFSTQEEPVTVFLIYTDLSAASVEMLKAFSASLGGELLEVRIEEDPFEKAPVMQHFSKEMYYRLLCPWLLPSEERVLYLDPDIIVNDSLRSLWEMELDGALLAAARDRTIEALGSRTKYKLKKDSVYFNSGVLLMDLKRMREEIKREEVRALMIDRKEDLEFPDQDMLNLLCEDRFKLIENAYNLAPIFLYPKEYLGTLSKKRTKHFAKIVHYAGPKKPWNSGYRRAMFPLWARAEWHTHPSSRLRIAGRLLLEPYRFAWGLWPYIKNHDWKKGFRKQRTE